MLSEIKEKLELVSGWPFIISVCILWLFCRSGSLRRFYSGSHTVEVW